MKTTREYLEETRTRLNFKNDTELAEWLGVQKTAISNYKHGSRTIDDFMAAKIAEALQIPAIQVIAVANLEREKDEKRRRYWQNFLHGMAGSAVVLLSLFLLQTGEDQYNHWLSVINGATKFADNIHYAQYDTPLAAAPIGTATGCLVVR